MWSGGSSWGALCLRLPWWGSCSWSRHRQGEILGRLKQCCLLIPLALERALAFPCSFCRNHKISKWISFPYHLGALLVFYFCCVPRWVGLYLGPSPISLPIESHCIGAGFPIDTCICYSFLCGPCMHSSYSTSLQVLFRSCSICRYRFGVSMGGVNSRSSYTAILYPSPHFFLTRIIYQLNMVTFIFSYLFLINDLKYSHTYTDEKPLLIYANW